MSSEKQHSESVSMVQSFPLSWTKHDVPGIWERGGLGDITGFCHVIAGRNGGRLTPMFIRRNPGPPCADHALFRARPGMTVVEARSWAPQRGKADALAIKAIEVFHLTKVPQSPDDDAADRAIGKLVAYHNGDKWVIPLPTDLLKGVVDMARRKVCMYHCRMAMWYDAVAGAEVLARSQEVQDALKGV